MRGRGPPVSLDGRTAACTDSRRGPSQVVTGSVTVDDSYGRRPAPRTCSLADVEIGSACATTRQRRRHGRVAPLDGDGDVDPRVGLTV